MQKIIRNDYIRTGILGLWNYIIQHFVKIQKITGKGIVWVLYEGKIH